MNQVRSTPGPTTDPPCPATGSDSAASPRFHTTCWRVVLEAGCPHSPGALDALEQLCRTYQFPVYAEIRRRGSTPADAQDLAQGFFERLLGGAFFSLANPARGRFRNYLLTSLNHFLADEAKRGRAQRRGGGVPPVALDGLQAEERYRLEPADLESPASLYERRFALTLLENALARLEREFSVFGSPVLFRRLQDYLADDGPEALSYAQLGAELGLSVEALKSAIYRLRRRYREVLRDEIQQVVASPEEVEEELRYLFRVLAG